MRCFHGKERAAVSSAARELRYDYTSRNAVYGDLAYDLDRELRERELRHAGEAPRQQAAAVERPKVRRVTKPQARPRQRVSAVSVIGFAAVAVLAFLVLMSYVDLTRISTEVVRLQNELEELETENVSLTAEYQRMFDLNTVKEAAEAADMGKPSSSQIYYVDLSDGDNAVVYQKEDPSVLSRLLTSLDHGIYAVVEYFK